MKYKQKDLVVHAKRWEGNPLTLLSYFQGGTITAAVDGFLITTSTGTITETMFFRRGDWIVKGLTWVGSSHVLSDEVFNILFEKTLF